MNGANDAENICFEYAAIIVQGRLGEGSFQADSGIGDDDIDAPGFITYDFGGAFEVPIAGDIASNGNGASSEVSDGGGGGIEGVFAAGEQSDVGAFQCESTAQGSADAGGSASDEYGLS